MAVKESLKFNWFEIKSNIDSEETIDLRAGTAMFEYRESVFSPYIEVTAYWLILVIPYQIKMILMRGWVY